LKRAKFYNVADITVHCVAKKTHTFVVYNYISSGSVMTTFDTKSRQ